MAVEWTPEEREKLLPNGMEVLAVNSPDETWRVVRSEKFGIPIPTSYGWFLPRKIEVQAAWEDLKCRTAEEAFDFVERDYASRR
jgi:hypothetical protein